MWTRRVFLFLAFFSWTALCVGAHQYNQPLLKMISGAIAAAQRPPRPRSKRFPKNHKFNDTSLGDLARNTRLKMFQGKRAVVFSTDNRGYRQNGSASIENTQVLVIGDSYGVGAGQADADTFPAQLNKRLGVPVYNQSHNLPPTTEFFDDFLNDKGWLNAPHLKAIVIIRALRMATAEGNHLASGGTTKRKPRPQAPPAPSLADIIRVVKTRIEQGSKLRKWFQDTHETLKFRVLNRHSYVRKHNNVNILTLPAGAQQLLGHRGGAANALAERLRSFSKTLEERGVSVFMVAVPEALTTYPELLRPNEVKRLRHPSFLDELLQKCDELKLNCVDLRPVFQANREPYLYLKNDSHWTARAAALAARVVAQAVEPKLKATRPTQPPKTPRSSK